MIFPAPSIVNLPAVLADTMAGNWEESVIVPPLNLASKVIVSSPELPDPQFVFAGVLLAAKIASRKLQKLSLVVVSSKVLTTSEPWLNVAVQVLSASRVTEVRLDVPEQAPLQPAKLDLASAVAVNETTVPGGEPAEQLPEGTPALREQLMLGAVTVPVPLPAPLTVSVLRAGPATSTLKAPRPYVNATNILVVGLTWRSKTGTLGRPLAGLI